MVARILRVGNRINHSINTDIKNHKAGYGFSLYQNQ